MMGAVCASAMIMTRKAAELSPNILAAGLTRGQELGDRKVEVEYYELREGSTISWTFIAQPRQ